MASSTFVGLSPKCTWPRAVARSCAETDMATEKTIAMTSERTINWGCGTPLLSTPGGMSIRAAVFTLHANAAEESGRASLPAHEELPHALFAERVDRKRQGDQPRIEPDALAGNVAAIEEQRGARRGRADDLRQAGETGPDAKAIVVAGRAPAQSGGVGGGQRTRADGAHLTAQHVDELRQLVEAGAAQDASDTGDPAVA